MSIPELNILIVEDELIISEALRQMIKDIGHSCSAIASNFEEGLTKILNSQYDLAILDINILGKHSGITLGTHCSQLGKPFFFLTSYSDYDTIQAAKIAKPGAYLVKPFTPQDILVAIEMTMMHSKTIGVSQFEMFIKSLNLSERESQVLACLKDQLTNLEIANRLFITKDTVKFHVKNLYVKLGITSRSELLLLMQNATN